MIKNLILKGQFSKFLSSWKLAPNGSNEEASAFEKFVNYMILSLDDPGSFVGDPDLLDLCSTGGGDDAKLDGIGLRVNGHLVQSEEEILQIVSNSKKVDIEFVLIQSKERPDFDSSEFNTFGIGVQNFFSEPRLPENEKVQLWRRLKDYVYNEPAVIHKIDDNPSVSVYYVFCGEVPCDQHTESIKNIVKDNLRKCPDSVGNVSISILGAKELIHLCKESENDYTTQLTICDIIPLTVNNNKLIKKAYAFTCEAQELLKLLTKEDDTIRRSLFNDNVRDYLGNEGAVNSEIERTIQDEPEMFLMCNNGITIVCSDFLQIKDKLVSIDNPQIVNGCQTCNSIFSQKNSDSISRVQVLVKLICTEEFVITNKIVRGTNKQNQVLEEAFETTKPFHQELEDYFLAKKEPVQLYYERRNKQYSMLPSVNKFQIVNLRVITQSFVAMFLQQPYIAHRHEAKLLEMYAGDSRVIYKEGQPLCPYYVAAYTWHCFEEVFRCRKLSNSLKAYKAHLYLLFLYSMGKYPLSITAHKEALEKYCSEIERALTSTAFDETINTISSLFQKCAKEWKMGGNSQYAMKEKKEFTDLLICRARELFIPGDKAIDSPKKVEVDEIWADGEILSVRVKNGSWFAFIRTDKNVENVYFDHNAFKGEFSLLIPGVKVRFIEDVREKNGQRMAYAKNVVLA